MWLTISVQNVKCLPNPAMFSLNEIVFGISTPDILFHLSREEIRHKPSEPNPLARLSKAIITQQNFYPLFPPPVGSAGVNLDVPNLRLADFINVTPDVLVLPSVLPSSAKIVDGVVVVNPGCLSKKLGSGSYVKMTVVPAEKFVEEGGPEGGCRHRVYERARVEVVRI